MPTRSVSVLVIEDNPGDVRLVEDSLAGATKAAFEVTAVDRMSQALRRLANGGIDVVVLDLSLPDSLGLDSFASVHDRAPHVPIVVLSGLNHGGMADQILREGAHAYLLKSQFEADALQDAILDAIDKNKEELAARRARTRDEAVLSEAEERRQRLYESIADGDAEAWPFPSDVTLFALTADYGDMLDQYVRAVRNGSGGSNGHVRPSADVGEMAQRLAQIRAGGHHVVRLHQHCLTELGPGKVDRMYCEDARPVLVELLCKLVALYLNAC